MPAAERKYGLLVLKFLVGGLLIAVPWIWFWTLPEIKSAYERYQTQSPEALLAAMPEDFEADAIAKFQDPGKPEILTKPILDRDQLQNLVSGEKVLSDELRRITSEYESKINGFNTSRKIDHHPFSKENFWGNEIPVIELINIALDQDEIFERKVNNFEKTLYVYEEQDTNKLEITGDQKELLCLSMGYVRRGDRNNRVNQIRKALPKEKADLITQITMAALLTHIGFKGFYDEDTPDEEVQRGLENCIAEPQPVISLRPGLCYISETEMVPCGDEFVELVRLIVEAKGKPFVGPYEQKLAAFDSEQARRAEVQKAYDAQVARTEGFRAAHVERLKADRAQYEAGDLTPAQVDVIRFALIGATTVSLLIFLLMGSRYAIIARPFFVPPYLWVVSAICFAGYVYALRYMDGTQSVPKALWIGFITFDVPFIALAAPTLRLSMWEGIKESHIYRDTFVSGVGGDSARWGGIFSAARMEITSYWFRARYFGMFKHKTGALFLGRTLWQDDTRIMGRYVGLISESHMITVANSRAGKSRDAVTANLLTWPGGVVAFDPAGEHVRTSFQRRAAYAPCYVIDPYGAVSDVAPTSFWNPLGEINPTSPAARSDLDRLTQALFISFRFSDETSTYFKEGAKIVIRGYMAHVMTALPPDKRHLGTVYDLLISGKPGGTTYDPAAHSKLLVEMAANSEIGGAPAAAVKRLMEVSEKERGSLLSTISNGIDWINDDSVRPIMSGKSSFSFRECKLNDASVFLVLPSKHITEMARLTRAFYTSALDVLDVTETPQPVDSERRVLMLFDEFNALGVFDPAEKAVNEKAKSYVKCWFILQNLNQLDKYENRQNFLSNCDLQLFGLHRADVKAVEEIDSSLGGYDHARGQNERARRLLPQGDLAEFLNAGRSGQVVIPVSGFPMKLRRYPFFQSHIPFWPMFWPWQYGEHQKRGEDGASYEPWDAEKDWERRKAELIVMKAEVASHPQTNPNFAYNSSVDWQATLTLMEGRGDLTDVDRALLMENIARQEGEPPTAPDDPPPDQAA